jgi:ankyrin repeat protein
MTDINADELTEIVTNENDVVVDAASAQRHGHKRKHEDEGEDDDDDDEQEDEDEEVEVVDGSGRELAELADEGLWDEVLKLVKSGTVDDVDFEVKDGRTVLWLAAEHGRADVVEALLQEGAAFSADKYGIEPLSVAANATIAKMLIEEGADVNAVNKRGESALLLAARNGRDDVFEVLLQAGADVNKADNYGDAPLSVATRGTIATMLIERGANLNAANRLGVSALLHGVVCDFRDVVEALVQAGADVNTAEESGMVPLVHAAGSHRWSILMTLARSNRLANIDAVNRDGRAALWLALRHDDWLAAEAREAATALICAGADVDCRWNHKLLLQAVANSGNTDNLSLLLAAGAATAGVSAVDCRSYNVILMMLAGGVMWTDHEIEQALSQCGFTGDDSDRALAEIWRQLPAAKKEIERTGFAAIRARVLEICIALQDMEMPAPQLIEIVTHTCAPFAAQLPYHYLWDAVVLVKHFRKAK